MSKLILATLVVILILAGCSGEYQPAQLEAYKGWGAKGKAQKALDAANEFYEVHRPQLTLYESAERYLRDVLQGRFDPKKLPPITKWKEKRARLIADKQSLTRDYHALKNEVAEAEKIRHGVYDIMSGERRRDQPDKSKDIER
ncbi:MAG: hypothetical protein FWE19_02415 [Oscillospiraceae bacterium]|nr:hypothetical protein [Oscillospiraceae bacterium]